MSDNRFSSCKRLVIKVGTSTLTYENGRLNLRRIESLCRVLSDLQSAGYELILVSSGAVGVGVGKLGLTQRPHATRERQAVAAVGQCELMFIYDKFFGELNQTVAQVLLTRDVIDLSSTCQNVLNTFETLLEMKIIPIVNENDTVATDELEGARIGDNDTLSAMVARITGADLLILLTDADGLYEEDPHKNPLAKRIDEVHKIDDALFSLAGGIGSKRGTGGMLTKLHAAQIALSAQIPVVIMEGSRPARIYDLLEGQGIGTRFLPEPNV